MDISFFLILILRQFPQLWMNFIQATCLASFAHCIRKHAQQMPQYLSKFLSSRVRRFGSFQRVWRGRHTAISFATLTELYKMLQHHLIWKGSFSKKTIVPIYHMHIYPSVTGSFTNSFFVWPFGCNLKRDTPLPKPDQRKVRRLQVPSTFLPTPNSNMHSQFKSKLEFDIFEHIFEKILSTHPSSGKILWKQNSHSKKNDLTWIAHQLWADSLNREKKNTWNGGGTHRFTQVTQWSARWNQRSPWLLKRWMLQAKNLRLISWGWDFYRKLYRKFIYSAKKRSFKKRSQGFGSRGF